MIINYRLLPGCTVHTFAERRRHLLWEIHIIGAVSYTHLDVYKRQDLEYGPIKNSAFLDGLSGAKLNIWGGAFSAAGDVYTQIWQSVTIDGKTAEEAMEEYYPALEKAFNEANGN